MSLPDHLATSGALCLSQHSFRYLRALLDYASINASNESSIYGAMSFILTLYCTSASVTSAKYKNLYLGSFPQKDLKEPEGGQQFRAPDFTVVIVQSRLGQSSTEAKLADTGPLICEVKASIVPLTWFGEERSRVPDLGESFMLHFHQITTQAVFAKAKFNKKRLYALLTIDVWFLLLCFPGDSPFFTENAGKPHEFLFRSEIYRSFDKYLAVPPAPIVNKDCTEFSPEFRYALQLSMENISDIVIMPHSLFRAPVGVADVVTRLLEEQQLPELFEREAQRVEREKKFALGEEDSDERSQRWYTSEEPETDVEHQKHPAAVPNTLDHLSTSPAKTRSRTYILRSRTVVGVAEEPNAAGPSRTQARPAVNLATKSKTRQRRKAGKKNEPSGESN